MYDKSKLVVLVTEMTDLVIQLNPYNLSCVPFLLCGCCDEADGFLLRGMAIVTDKFVWIIR